MKNKFLKQLIMLNVALLASFTNTTYNAYGYNDGDWLHRANAGADGIFVRVLDVSGVKKLYAFISQFGNSMYFVPASLLRSVNYTNDYLTTGFGLPSSFVTGIFEETAPSAYTVGASDRRVTAVSSVAVNADMIPLATKDSQIPNAGYMRVPTTTGIAYYNGFGNSATQLEGKAPVAIGGTVPTNLLKLTDPTANDGGGTKTNWWTKLPAYLRTTIIVAVVVVVIIILMKVIKWK